MTALEEPQTNTQPRLSALRNGRTDSQREALADQLRAGGVPHADMRDWLEMVDALGELRVLEGVDWQENIGRIAEMLVHSDGAPAVLFDKIPGYPDGYRILTNAQGERPRLAISLRSEEHTSELQSHSFISYAVF